MTDDKGPPPPPDPEDLEATTPSSAGPSETPAPEPGPSIPWRMGGFLLLTTLIVVFAVQNTQDVDLNFLGWNWNLPLVIVILIAALVAVLLDEVLGGLIKRRRLRARRERTELERLRSQE